METIFSKLERDLIFFDLETTGILLKEDRIIQLSAVKYTKSKRQITINYLFDPQRPIHPGASEIHKFTDEMLQGYPTFQESVDELWEFFNGCDLGGYNCLLFDIPLLFEEFSRCGKPINFFNVNIIDCYNLLNKFETRKLSDVYSRFFGEELIDAHDAYQDILATIRVFEKQIEKYELQDKKLSDISQLIRSTSNGEKILDFSGWFRLKDGEFTYGKGKWKGTPIKDNMDYLDWIIKNDNLENNSRSVASIIKKKLLKN